jgi:hypothetical protein
MAVKYEVCARGETYKTSSGEEKSRWIKCGIVVETKNGLAMKLESVPVITDGWFSFFEPKPREDYQSQQPRRQSAPASSSAADMDSDIPF